MNERDPITNPYTADEQRIVRHLQEITNHAIGGGEDPIGFFLGSHRYTTLLLREANALLNKDPNYKRDSPSDFLIMIGSLMAALCNDSTCEWLFLRGVPGDELLALKLATMAVMSRFYGRTE